MTKRKPEHEHKLPPFTRPEYKKPDPILGPADLRKKFDRIVGVKADLGFPFTMEDVADTLGCPSEDLRSSWLRPFVLADRLRPIDTMRARHKAARSRKITVWCGTYYLDLEPEVEEEAEAEAEADTAA